MDKNFLQDVVPPAGKKSIRNIPLPEHKKEDIPEDVNEEHRHIHPKKEVGDIRPKRTKADNNDVVENPIKRKRGWRKSLIVLAVLLVIFLALSFFSSAQVNIYPKVATATVDTSIPLFDTNTQTGLPYEITEITDSRSKTLSATGEEEVIQKAKGTIVIFNSYSDKDQKLISNTRFETSEGLIFRINESITVPGKSGDKPGSIEVQVVADEAGDEYNIGLADFTIPGFKGLPQFDGFYARSKTPMSGGFSGIKKVISEEDRAVAEKELIAEVEAALVNKAKTQFGGISTIVYNEDDIVLETMESSGEGNSVNLIVSGKLEATLLNKGAVSTSLAQQALVNYQAGDPITVENLDALEVSLDTEENLATFSGVANFKWITNISELKNDLAGKSRAGMNALMTKYPSIQKADAVLKPVWKRSFPRNTEKIEIVEIKG